MLEELKGLDPEWSMSDNMKVIGGAIKLLDEGKAPSESELYDLVKAKLKGAEDYFERPLDDPEIYSMLSRVAKKMNDSDMEAKANRQINVYKANELEFLGRQQQFYGNNVKAAEYYRQALELVPDHELAVSSLEKAQKRLDKSNDNLEKLEDKADRKGDNKSHIDLGKAYMDLGRVDDALDCFDMALENDENDIDALTRLGMALESQGKFKESLEYFDRAMEIKPTAMTAKRGKNYALYNLGEL